MKHSVLLYLSLAACLFTGCYEDEPQEEAREVQRITFRTDDNSWTSTRSVADGKERKFHMASEDGSRYMSMTVSEEPMTGRAATRGAQASSASISTFGVSGSLCMRNSSYTAVGCGSFFYNEEVAPGISMDYAWPTSDYKLSFFAYYPYGNDNLTMRSLATEKGIPAYSYTVPEDAADHVDVMTAQVTDMLGGRQSPVTLSFNHRCAALRFRLTNTGDNTMTVRSVTVAGVKYTGTLRNASWTLGSDTRSSVLSCNDTEVESGETVDLTDGNYMFMLPQTLPSTAKVILETEKNTFEGTISGSWTAGQVYTYSINANDAVNYLRFTALEDGTFSLKLAAIIGTANLKSVSYSIDEGETWITTDYTNTTMTITTPTVTAGNSVLWKGDAKSYNPSNSTSYASRFSSTGRFNVSGNIMSLLYGSKINNITFPNVFYTFCCFFYGCTKLIDASELILPATTLIYCCYSNMFSGCTSLVAAPELPATTLANMCYSAMFSGCTSLVTAPELPATKAYDYCYSAMFNGCTSLTVAPDLPATTLAYECYRGMFSGCTSLTVAPTISAKGTSSSCYQNMFTRCTSLVTAPELPAKSLADNCYRGMFSGCTSLVTAPELPATGINNYCYIDMFSGCTSLTVAPELPATTLRQGCYIRMFENCKKLAVAPELPATTLVKNCYSSMFNGCKSLASVKAAFTTISDASAIDSWLYGVASSGTFYKNAAATWDVTGANGVPSGWTVETYTPE